MTIVVDQNVPGAASALAQFGDVVVLPGRDIDRERIADADVLIVRSITKVDRVLLEGTPVRFVGTATSGVDHIDLGYLCEANITFAHAAGCNASSVAQYVVAALLTLWRRGLTRIAGMSIGIVGVGAIGSRLMAYADALGMNAIGFDPPRSLNDPSFSGATLDDVLACEVVSLHLPLTNDGPYATRGMVGRETLGRMPTGAILINTSRGAVVQNDSLVEWLQGGNGRAVLDVWEGEPSVPAELIELTELATPHIAGYSVDARLASARAMVAAVAEWAGGQAYRQNIDALAPVSDDRAIVKSDGDRLDRLAAQIASIYDIERDDADLRSLLSMDERDRRLGFDRLRRDYPPRREWRWSSGSRR